ncbi:MAG: hypothetical protein E7370_03840 [Clostridiales bacterium]|nr:hypothetical protein [Clostridiales bacterium]
MKIFTKILTAVLSLAMLFSVVGFTACTNGELQAKIAELEAQIATQQTQIEQQQEQIKALEQENQELEEQIKVLEQENQAYVLKIAAGKKVYNIEEEIFIDILLENHSGKDVEIAYYMPNLVVPESLTGEFPAIEQSPEMAKIFFKNGDTIHLTERVEDYFSVGQHELNYRALFYICGETEPVVVNSNLIEFSVVES